ncbi:hypothetical protein APHAL10511_005251 [Amanita phalloides]|nr:hypothetical protein APHAL10511_005251 [Amanita phalloides]
MSSASPVAGAADLPYDSTAVADTIIRSSDNAHFYVVGGLLCLVSPFFKEMFNLNCGPAAERTEKRDGLPIIPLPEDGTTIRLLLDFFHPHVKKPQLDDVGLLWNVGKAMKKYCMDVVEKKLISRIFKSKLIDQQPLSIYAVATDLEWEDVANSAARKSLITPLKSLAYVKELQGITGTGFYRFLEYRLRCDKSARPQEEELATTVTNANAVDAVDSEISPDVKDPLYGFDRFRSSPNGDLILRSSDSAEFYVSSALIRLVSPVFDSMFPLKDHESKDSRPVISVEETSEVLLHLLRVLYPDTDELETNDCRTYVGVITATRKYGMSAMERKIQRQVQKSTLILEEPLRIYLLATKLGWKDVEQMAALNTLFQSLHDIRYIAELDLVTGADLYRLVHFRFKCGDKACTALQADLDFSSYGNADSWYERRGFCYRPESVENQYEKLRARPRGSTVTNIFNQKIQEIRKRGKERFDLHCNAFSGILMCVHNAARVVEETVSQVTLEPEIGSDVVPSDSNSD